MTLPPPYMGIAEAPGRGGDSHVNVGPGDMRGSSAPVDWLASWLAACLPLPPCLPDVSIAEAPGRGAGSGTPGDSHLVGLARGPALALLVLTLLVRFRFSRSRSFHLRTV